MYKYTRISVRKKGKGETLFSVFGLSMDNMREFYITLPSWKSKYIFPINNPGDFYVKLPKQVNVHGDWKVGMTNTYIPRNWYNVNNGDNNIFIKSYETGEDIHVDILPGYYSSIDILISEINRYISEYKASLAFDSMKNKIFVTMNDPKIEIWFSSGICEILGIDDFRVITRSRYGDHPINLQGKFEYITVNCDIVEDQIMGDLKVPMIGYFSSKDTSYGDSLYSNVETQYITLKNKKFEVIHVWMCDTRGERIPFLQGKTIIQLHFIRK